MASEQANILDFFHKIWREEKAVVCLAFKNPSTGNFSREYFDWPTEEIPVVQKVLSARTSHEVYFSPALYRERSSKKEAVLGSFCFWVEFDGTMPIEFEGLPKPNLVVQSSTETHQHIYWTSDTLIPVERLEAVNRSLTYKLGADASGWDCNQVLRPPETLNHKKGLRTKLVAQSDHYVNSVAFSENLPKNIPPQIEIHGVLPDVREVISKYQYTLPQRVLDLLTKGVQRDRSSGLMNLGYSLAEMNMTNDEILSVLMEADRRWGKFKDRTDRIQRLTEIVTIARQKYPYKINIEDVELIAIDHETLLTTEVDIDWLWEGILYQSGFLMLTGHSGVGKSQLAMNLADHLILGEKFLGREVSAGKRVLFISLEMEQVELKQFRSKQAGSLTVQQRNLLKENFLIVPQGYATPYNRDEEKIKLEAFIQKNKIDVVMFDTLSAMTEQELSKETDAKDIMDWIGRLRTQLGVAVVILHHHRKAQAGNKSPNELSDVYGSMLFQARPTSILSMWEERKKGLIKVTCLKMRLAPKPKPFYILRKDDLTFTLSDQMIVPSEDIEIEITDDEEVNVTTSDLFGQPDVGFEF